MIHIAKCPERVWRYESIEGRAGGDFRLKMPAVVGVCQSFNGNALSVSGILGDLEEPVASRAGAVGQVLFKSEI